MISLLFNVLSRFVISFPSKEKASFNFMATPSPSAVILEPKKVPGKGIAEFDETQVNGQRLWTIEN